MIWTTVSSRSCFCWLYRASPSLAAKNIINLILVLTIWWCPCKVFSCIVGSGWLLWPVSSLGKTLLAFCPALYSKAKFACYSGNLLTSYFCIPVPYDEKGMLKNVKIIIYLNTECSFLSNFYNNNEHNYVIYWICFRKYIYETHLCAFCNL